MRILIFILALMSAFFVHNAFAETSTEQVTPKCYGGGTFNEELQTCLIPAQPESISQCILTHDGVDYTKTSKQGHQAACVALLESSKGFLPDYDYDDYCSGSYCRNYSKSDYFRYNASSVYLYARFEITYTCATNPTCTPPPTETLDKYRGRANYDGVVDKASCPPPNAPNYKTPIDLNNLFYCSQLPSEQDCPAGYHSKSVSQQLGSSECLPKECPAAGSGENLSSTPMTGGVPFNGGGMYCNDGCAYTVNTSQISSPKYAVGTSQGAACGDKPYDNKKLADEGDTGNCTTATNGDVTLLSCPDANPTTPEPDPHNNDESKVNEDDTPEKPKETCAEGDTSCNLKNVETEIENSINRQIDNDNKLHNKKIDADTKNAKAFLNVMDSIDTAILLQTSQDERLHAVTVGKFNELIDAVNGIETGGGGGGGNGTGNGNIGGQDCEGTIEECAGIGSGDGVELPHETKNLEQYAQKYQNWLPDAELPQEKCITLTTGYTACFSFHYIIYFLQALSGLIVLSSLIHSAAIIVRSV